MKNNFVSLAVFTFALMRRGGEGSTNQRRAFNCPAGAV
jgi:hypothetical protein